jgi:hypothetical protein
MARSIQAAGIAVLAWLSACLTPFAASATEDWSACRRAIATVEPGSGLPPGLLLAIALVESGRRNPATGRIEPWPWAFNTEGEGRLPPDRAAALAAVRALQARGVRSIDVGCMQVNLAHHPEAFASLEQAFEAEANVRYAARFLLALRARTGDWPQAIANYHSGDDLRGLRYHRRVALAQIGAGLARGGGPVPLPAAAARGLCAAGMSPVLVFGPNAARGGAARRPPPPVARPRVVCRRPGRS